MLWVTTGIMPWVMPWMTLGEDWDHALSNAWVMLWVMIGIMPWVMPWVTPQAMTGLG